MECFIDSARTPSQRRIAACIDHWLDAHDRRALFAAGYAMAVDNVMATTRAGRFLESAWVLQLLAGWAEYYLITVEAEGDDLSLVTPPAWRDAHSATAVPETAPVDALLLGLNAHVNNDLAQALADELRREWPLPEPRMAMRRTDFDKTVRIVAETLSGSEGLLERFDMNLAAPRRCWWVVRSTCTDLAALVADWAPQVWADALTLVTAVDDRWAGAIRDGVECAAARRAHLLMCDIAGRDTLVRLPSPEVDERFPHRHRGSACALAGAAPVWGEMAASATP